MLRGEEVPSQRRRDGSEIETLSEMKAETYAKNMRRINNRNLRRNIRRNIHVEDPRDPLGVEIPIMGGVYTQYSLCSSP